MSGADTRSSPRTAQQALADAFFEARHSAADGCARSAELSFRPRERVRLDDPAERQEFRCFDGASQLDQFISNASNR